MVTILIRTLIVYVALIGTMRFMGKRQLGELEISDLVTTLLLSDIATLPITNTDLPLSHALIPILTLTSLEVVLSGVLLKLPSLKRVLSVRPAILVRHGKPDRAVMRSVRVSAEELLSQLRQKVFSIPTHQFLFNAGSVNKRFYMDNLQLEESEFELIRYPQRGVCLYKCGNERYLLQVIAPKYKAELFGTAGGR